MTYLLNDLRYGLRVLAKNPGFALAAVIVLALGIGANTAIFSVVNAVLLRPLPFPQPDRIMQLWHTPPAKSFPGMKIFSVSPANFLDWRSQSRSFDKMAAYGFAAFSISGDGQPEELRGARVTQGFFDVLRVQPAAGRTFLPAEDQYGNSHFIILSNTLWQTRFGSDPAIVGRTILLSGAPYTVAGIMPAHFRFPDWAQFWVPMGWTPEQAAVRGNHNYLAIGRLKDGVTQQQAQAELSAISANLERLYPADDKGWGATMVSLHEQMVGEVRPALLVLLGAVAFVLLIACANVANLVLAKTMARRKEMAIRAALGASRGRVMQQLLVETLVLALAGGALGLLFAQSGVSLIVNFLADKMPRSAEISLDASVLLFTLFASLLTGVLAGLLPAFRFARTNVNESLKQGLGKTDADSGGARTRRVLVVSEVALSLILLVGAGLMIRSLWLLRTVDPGFDSRDVLTAVIALPRQKYSAPAQQAAFFRQVLDRVRAMPGVDSAGLISALPLSGDGSTQPIAVEGHPVVPMADQPEVAVREISPGFLASMRIALVEGRDFNSDDVAGRPGVILVSESMARRFWPGEDALGKRLKLTFRGEDWLEVVGVVRDIRQDGLNVVQPVATIYDAAAQNPSSIMGIVLRASRNPESQSKALIAAVHAVDPQQPVSDILTMEQLAETSLAPQRFSMMLLAAFALLALLLAAVGIYSVLAYSVRRRVREIGIRMALGARPGDVLRLIVLDGMKPTLAGVAIGLAGAFALGRVVASLIYGVTPTDALTFALVAVLLTAVGFFACLLPAYRATRIEPSQTLRME